MSTNKTMDKKIEQYIEQKMINYIAKNNGVNNFKKKPAPNFNIILTRLDDANTLVKIFECGMFLCRNLEPTFEDHANPESLGKTPKWVKDYCRLHFNKYCSDFPTPDQYCMIHGYKSCKNPISKPVYVFFSNWLYSLNSIKITNKSPVASDFIYTSYDDYLNKKFYLDWGKILSRGPIYGNKTRRQEVSHTRNAELLVYEEIPIYFIEKLVFKNYSDRENFLESIKNNKDFEYYKKISEVFTSLF